MRDLVYDLKRLCERNRDGSIQTQWDRKRMLMLIGEQLVVLGWRDMRATDLKGRHVQRLVATWKAEGLSPGTIANRLSALRWWSARIDRVSIMPKTNGHYDLEPRQRIPSPSPAFLLPEDVLPHIPDPHIRLSLQLQQWFGCRREESLKLSPHEADYGDMLFLRGSWTKGGRERWMPLLFPEQTTLLTEAKVLVRPGQSLIPEDLTYIQHRRRYDYLTAQVGLHRVHGLRHCFAHRVYAHLTGWDCPAAGGPPSAALSPEQQASDMAARRQLSAMLGHSRLDIARTYCGS